MALLLAGLGEDIAKAILTGLANAFTGGLVGLGQTILNLANSLGPIILTTAPADTYANPAVDDALKVMLAVANLLLILMTMTGGIQMMVGRATGVYYVPPEQFVPRVFLVGLAANCSLLFVSMVIDIERGLCSLTLADLTAYLNSISNGNHGAASFIYALLMGMFAITFLWIIFQQIERLLLIDLLIVFSPLRMLMFLLQQTTDYAKLGSRLFLLSVLVQFLQLEAFDLGAKFLAGSGLVNDPTTALILGIGMLFFIGSIPRMLYRFGLTSAGGNTGGAPTRS